MNLKIAACVMMLILPDAAAFAQGGKLPQEQPRDCMAMLAACFDAAGGEAQAERRCLSAYAEVCMWTGPALQQAGLPGVTPARPGVLEGG